MFWTAAEMWFRHSRSMADADNDPEWGLVRILRTTVNNRQIVPYQSSPYSRMSVCGTLGAASTRVYQYLDSFCR